MYVDEYLENNELDYEDVILQDTEGNVIVPSTLVKYCTIICVEGNRVTIK